jgi:hypothetical protein
MKSLHLFRLPLVVGGLLLSTVALVRAQAPAATPHPVNSKVSGKEYVLSHTSNYQATPNGQRNPFWPIGWVPSAAAPTAVAQQQLDVRADQFVVTSISVDYPPLAVINGKTRAVGDHIPVSADNREFVLVKQILDGEVVLDYRGHELRSFSGKPRLSR